MNTAKRIPQVLDAFSRLLVRRPEAQLVLAGGHSPGFDLERLLESRNLGDAVVRYDYLAEESLWQLIADSDVLVNLRSPTMGETSAMVVRALSLGKPIVVSDVGWFSELPDEVAIKVPVDDGETEALVQALERLAGDAAYRERMGKAAADWARREHDLDRTADLYVAALEESLGLERRRARRSGRRRECRRRARRRAGLRRTDATSPSACARSGWDGTSARTQRSEVEDSALACPWPDAGGSRRLLRAGSRSG